MSPAMLGEGREDRAEHRCSAVPADFAGAGAGRGEISTVSMWKLVPGHRPGRVADGSSGPGEQAGRRMTELIAGAHQSDTHQKALRINLDPRWYGTVAEIGAGQEVVRWFFRVGGAAGTIAK